MKLYYRMKLNLENETVLNSEIEPEEWNYPKEWNWTVSFWNCTLMSEIEPGEGNWIWRKNMNPIPENEIEPGE